MRRLYVSLLGVSLMASVAFAQDAGTAAASLKQNMKQIGSLFKGISATVNDPSKNADNAASADQMNELFKACQVLVPEVVSEMPSDQQPAALEQFKGLIQKEIDYTAELATDFRNNDNAGAADICAKMKDTKKDGHDTFNPN